MRTRLVSQYGTAFCDAPDTWVTDKGTRYVGAWWNGSEDNVAHRIFATVNAADVTIITTKN